MRLFIPTEAENVTCTGHESSPATSRRMPSTTASCVKPWPRTPVVDLRVMFDDPSGSATVIDQDEAVPWRNKPASLLLITGVWRDLRTVRRARCETREWSCMMAAPGCKLGDGAAGIAELSRWRASGDRGQGHTRGRGNPPALIGRRAKGIRRHPNALQDLRPAR